MKMTHVITPKTSIFILSFLILANASIAQQSKLDQWLQKRGQDIRDLKVVMAELTGMTKQYKLMKAAINTNSTEYNKNVNVAKGNNGSTNPNPGNIPEKEQTKPRIKDNNFVNLVWEPANFFDGQLFPSAIISMASYQGTLEGISEAISRPIGFSIYSTKQNIPLKYEIESVDKRYFDKVSGAYMYAGGKEDYLCPAIPWNYASLTSQMTSAPISLYFRLFDEDGNKVEKLVTWQLRSINDCIYAYKDVDMRYMFSAFVQEEDKEIDGILREALNTKMAKRWVGYQSDAKEVDEQVAAIWRVLHEKGFVYSSITANVGDEGNVHSQAVRTFDNAIKTQQANCVDGTVVFASILKKISIDPIMILVPGHCFLGYYTDEKHTSVKFVETTWLSHTFTHSADGKEIEVLGTAKTNDEKNKAYRKIFDDAQTVAMNEYQKYNGENTAKLIDVTKYRQLIKPIPVY